MLLFSILAGALAVMLFFPRTPVAKALHRLTVETTVARLARVRPGHLLFAAILGAVGTAMFILFEIEGLRLFTFMAPELAAWFAMFDVAVFLDVFVLTVAITATARFRAVRDQSLPWLHRLAVFARHRLRATGRARTRRARPIPSRPARPDDPDPAGWRQLAFG